jgi:VWFA-related protein
MTNRARFVLSTVVVFAAAAAGFWQSALTAQAPQAPEVTFQVEVNYVDVDTIVTDEQGNFVTGLTRDDFEVFEDGKPQKVEMFSYVEIPVERTDGFVFMGRPVTSDARSNRQALTGRVYVIVLDDLDISPIRTGLVKRLARDFVEKYLGANDAAAVIYTSGRADASQDFTSNRQLLLAAIDKFVGRRFRSLTLDKLDRYYQRLANTQTDEEGNIPQRANLAPGGHRLANAEDIERSQRALGVMDTLTNLSEFLAGIRGRRKALVMFSEGIDYPLNDVYGAHIATDIVRATQDAISRAARSNVNFFTIDPRGLAGVTTEFIEMQGSGAPELLGTGPGKGNATVTGDLVPMNAQADLLQELRLSQDSLRTLAEETGGFAAVNTNSFAAAFDRIVDNNSRYYVLGYYPPSHPRDGRFHRIEVRVKRPGLRVSARKGYASPRGKTAAERKRDEDAKRARDRADAKRGAMENASPELRDALNSPIQQSGLSFTVQAAPFRGPQKEGTVGLAIEIDGDRLPFAEQKEKGVFANKLELAFFSVSEQGRAQRATRTEFNLTLRPETYERVKARGLRLNPRLALEPGRYQIRIGLREAFTGQTGSVFYDLIVPDFRKEQLALSGLLLTAPSAQAVMTAHPDPSAPALLAGPATSRREFRTDDTLTVLADLYDNASPRQPRQIDASVALISENGKEAFSARESLTNGPSAPGGNWMAFALKRDIPLKNVPPGSYLLRVEVQVRGSKDAAPAVRETLITVVGS